MTTRKQAEAMLARADAETAERLRASHQAIADAEAAVDVAKQIRAAVIAEAADAGWSQARIAEVLGLSKQRVAQIAAASE